MPGLLVPAASLAFVGLVQGAGVSAGFPNPDRSVADPSRDFVGQGAGNVVSGVFRGTPVGGSMSATSLVVGAGARNRIALLFAAVVMALVIVAPRRRRRARRDACAGGAAHRRGCRHGQAGEDRRHRADRSGAAHGDADHARAHARSMPLQYAVLVGVGLSVLLFVIGQSTPLSDPAAGIGDDGADHGGGSRPPSWAPARSSCCSRTVPMFFATASVLRDQMPAVTDESSRRSVVILRLRGADDAGVTLLDVLAHLRRRARRTWAAGS